MTAPDTRDSVERIVAEMRERLVGWDNDCDEMAKADDLAKWMDRLSALPQQAGGEDALQAEVARLSCAQVTVGATTLACSSLVKEMFDLQQAALREAGRDAERYRWLRDNCKREWESDMPHNKGAPSLDIEFEASGHDLDAAIDAARLVRDGDSGEG